MSMTADRLHLPAAEQERFVVMGQRVTVRVTPAQTDGACFAFDCVADPGMGVPMHVHDHEDELFILRRGTIRATVGDHAVIATAGDTLFGPRGVPHAWEAIGAEPAEMLVVVTPGNLDVMFRELSALTAADFPRVAAICAAHGVRFA